jgi:glycosyltransferase involved in cell wall biosynthesis
MEPVRESLSTHTVAARATAALPSLDFEGWPAPPPIAAVSVEGRRRRWSINGDFTTLRPTGVARYARETTLALDALMAERHPLAEGLDLDILVPRPMRDPLPLRALPVRLVPEYSRPRLPQFWVQAQLPWHVEGGVLSFCNLAPVALKRQIVCVHDLHTIMAPDSYGLMFRWFHRLILPVLGRRAAAVTTVSEFSRSCIAACRVAPASKVAVTYNGSDHVDRWDEGRSGLARRSEWPYVLCLAQRQRYKNVELLVRLAPVLERMGLDLWIAGDMDPGQLASAQAGRATNVRLLGRVGDDDLRAALAGALCFLFPSRIEGFGLPAIEAMAAGCPVVASTSPCLPEICGDAALYADPGNPGEWIERVRQLQDDETFRRRIVAAGQRRAAAYSWRRVAETYLELMASIDGIAIRPESEAAGAPA